LKENAKLLLKSFHDGQNPIENWLLYPTSGYSVWWSRAKYEKKKESLSQTVVIWSNFPGNAHKHADEMGVLLWINGVNWWAHSGYWPYGTTERSNAISWSGSNAPHLSKEKIDSLRKTELLTYASSDNINFLELERKGPGRYRARRQIVQIKDEMLFVLDYVHFDQSDMSVTKWMTAPGSNVTHDKNMYTINVEGSRPLVKWVSGSEGVSHYPIKGQLGSFGGWNEKKNADAIVVSQSSDSWACVFWLLPSLNLFHNEAIKEPKITNWTGPNFWEAELFTKERIYNLSRDGNEVKILEDTMETIPLLIGPNVLAAQNEIMHKKKRASQQFAHIRLKMDWCIKFTIALAAGSLILEVFFIFLKYNRSKF
jgi:hypothetical protein